MHKMRIATRIFADIRESHCRADRHDGIGVGHAAGEAEKIIAEEIEAMAGSFRLNTAKGKHRRGGREENQPNVVPANVQIPADGNNEQKRKQDWHLRGGYEKPEDVT